MMRNDAVHTAKIIAKLDLPPEQKLKVAEAFGRDYEEMFSRSIYKFDRVKFELMATGQWEKVRKLDRK